jgi:GTP-binding protein YchF
MKVGLIGLPQSGKSTVFAAVTGQRPDPHAMPEPRPAIVKVPDPRLQFLASLFQPKKVVEAAIEFVDIPGFSLSDAKGQDDLRRLMPTIRQMELLTIVVRDFENPAVAAYKDRVNPAADLDEVWEELLFADLDQVTTRLERLDKSLKKPSKTHDQEKKEQAVLIRCREALENNQPLSSAVHTQEDERLVASFAFVTLKPIVCVRNVSESLAGEQVELTSPHLKASLSMSAEIEAEIAGLEEADRAAFMADLGIKDVARDRLIRTCYDAGGFISFLTMGPDECRAWTIHKGSTAVEAAGKIHSDLARGFVRAETIAYDDLVAAGDAKSVKAAGKARKEGKTYVVADGDILNILATT